jgi:hypothetical protein
MPDEASKARRGKKKREEVRKIASYLPWKVRTRREEARRGEKRRKEARRGEKRREHAERGENTETFNDRNYGVNRFLPVRCGT